MVDISTSDLVSWCAERRITVEQPSMLKYLSGRSCTAHAAALPDGFDGRVAVARAVLHPVDPSRFSGGVIWLSAWGMGDDVVGPGLYEAIRRRCGLRTDADAPTAILFESVEADECLVFYSLFAVVGWDAYFIPSGGGMFAFLSNDDFVDVVSEDDDHRKQILGALAAWHPEQIPGDRNRYCKRND